MPTLGMLKSIRLRTALRLSNMDLPAKTLLRIVAIDAFILPALAIYLFFNPWTSVSASSQETGVDMVGSATKNLMDKLRGDGLDPVAIKKIERRHFSVEGRIITLGGDNIQVFEYPDHESAVKEAAAIAEIYANSSRPAWWKKQMHVYVNGTLTVFYMGNRDSIVSSLDQNAGLSLTQPATSSSDISRAGG